MGVSTKSNNIRETQKVLRERICRHGTPPQIQGYEQERSTLRDVIQRTGELGESNSILVIGPRGAGKTMLLNSVLKELEENEGVKNNLLQIHLNGLLQTDDRIALKEITRQLQLENTVGDRVFGSFSENLQFLLDALKSGSKHTKSILFVLDEFDLFAQHKNQTLLYNLFDVSQAAMAPVCVLGMTTRLDVIELLEKRVKSRFSHRQLHLLPTLSFEEYVGMFRSILSLPDDFPNRSYAKEWNKNIQALCTEEGVQDVLRRRFNMDKDIRSLHTFMSIPICKLSENHPRLQAADFVDAAKHLNLDSKAAMLHGVSILELCLIIAMKHLTETYDSEPFNFEMVYKEYHRFATRRSQQMFDKAVVLKAFEHLVELELVRPMEGLGAGSKLQKEYRLMTLLVDPSQLNTALQNCTACPTDVRQWANSSIV